MMSEAIMAIIVALGVLGIIAVTIDMQKSINFKQPILDILKRRFPYKSDSELESIAVEIVDEIRKLIVL